MDIQYAWPLFTLFLMFVSFWYGKVVGFIHGEDEGFQEGIIRTSTVVTTVILRWVRENKDVEISDFEISKIVDGINITRPDGKPNDDSL